MFSFRYHEEELGQRQQQWISGQNRERCDLCPQTQLHGELIKSSSQDSHQKPADLWSTILFTLIKNVLLSCQIKLK